MFRILISLIVLFWLSDPTVAKEYNGSAWVDDACKYYNGSAWVDCTKNYYDGAAWQGIESTGECAGGSDGALNTGVTVNNGMAQTNLTPFFLYSLVTPNEDGTITYAHWDTTDAGGDNRLQIYTHNTSTGECTFLVSSAMQTGTDSDPDSYDVAIEGTCLVAGQSYAIGVWIDPDGDGYDGIYNVNETTGASRIISMTTSETNFDDDNAVDVHATRPVFVWADNSPTR